MTPRLPLKPVFNVIALMLLGALASTAAAADAIPAAPAFTAEQLVAAPARNWITNGGNAYNQRYSPLHQINQDNVDGLKAEWRTRLRGSGTGPRNSAQGQSLVYEGVLYIITGDNDVFALDVESGEILWQYTADLDPDRVHVCSGWTNRGRWQNIF